MISVIIPTHNRAELVLRAMDSALCQSEATEVIVVDDGSTDDSRQILEERRREEPRVRLITQACRGAAAARNRGAAVAQGDVLVFLDSDDELLPQSLAVFAAGFRDPTVGAVCSAAMFVDANGAEKSISHPRPLGPAYNNQKGLFLAGTFAVRRDTFQELGGFAVSCRSSQHTEFALRLIPYLMRDGRRLKVSEDLTVRVHVHEQAHLRGDVTNLLEGALYIIETHGTQLRQSARYFSDWHNIAAVYAAKMNRLGLARSLFLTSIWAYPRNAKNLMRLVIACLPPIARRVWRVDVTK